MGAIAVGDIAARESKIGAVFESRRCEESLILSKEPRY